jgi:hypothetical protein
MTKLFTEVAYKLSNTSGQKSVLLMTGAIKIKGKIEVFPSPQFCFVEDINEDSEFVGKLLTDSREGVFPEVSCRLPTLMESSSITRHSLLI